jgi:integrase
VAQAKWAATKDLDVASYLKQWLGYMRGRVRPGTFGAYECMLRLYAIPALGAIPLAELHPLQIQQLYGDLLGAGSLRFGRGLSAGYVLNLHRVLVQSLGAALRWGLIPTNPAAAAQPPRPRRPELGQIDPALATRILEVARGARLLELPIAIALATGMRRGEILGLRWADLDQDYTVARVRRSLQSIGGLSFEEPKTARSRRAVLLPQFLRPYLLRQREDQARRRREFGAGWNETDQIVDRPNGAPVNPATFSAEWSKFVRRKGLPRVRFHDLRHAHATLMLLQGIHPKIVSERLGHSNIGITLDIYSHVLPTMQVEAAQAFDALFGASSERAQEQLS